MNADIHDILLVEDNPGDARLVELMLNGLEGEAYRLTTADRMSEALKLLETREFEATLLDMSLPDGEGMDNISTIKSSASELPIVVLSGNVDENFAMEAVKAGAQDYLVKSELDELKLSRALNFAIERKRQHDDILYLAHHDQLTGLANRSLFKTKLEHAIHSAKRRGELAALLYLDLDHFKPINDEFGHGVGDALLIDVANRLSSSIRAVDTVGRLGGDEFAIVLEGIKEVDNVSLVADKIIALLLKPFKINGLQLTISCSMGIAFYPHFGLDIATLMRNADSAMYQAKNHGGNRYQVYGNMGDDSVVIIDH